MPRHVKLCPVMRTSSGGGMGLRARCRASTPRVRITRRDAVVERFPGACPCDIGRQPGESLPPDHEGAD